MCFLASKKPKSKPKPQQLPKILCPFQFQPQNRTSNLPHHILYPPPPPNYSSFYFSRPTKKSQQENKEKERKEQRRMNKWASINAIPYPPPPSHQNEAMPFPYHDYNYNNTFLSQQSQELERYKVREREEKEESQRKLMEQIAATNSTQAQELQMLRERQIKREEELQGVMMTRFFESLNGAERERGGNGGEEEWKRELGALRKEVEDQRREGEMKDAVVRARAEVLKEFEEKESRGYKENNRERDRDDWERGYTEFGQGRGAGEYTGRDTGRAREVEYERDTRGRRGTEDRFEDLEILGRGMAIGRQEARSLITPRRREATRGLEYGSQLRYIEDSEDFPGYDYGMPWNRPPPPSHTQQEPVRRGGDLINERLTGIENSQRRIEEKFTLEEARTGWEEKRQQRDMFGGLIRAVGNIEKRIGC